MVHLSVETVKKAAVVSLWTGHVALCYLWSICTSDYRAVLPFTNLLLYKNFLFMWEPQKYVRPGLTACRWHYS